jgi:hypothetical protein
MATHEEKVHEFLKAMGYVVQLMNYPPNPPALKNALINHMGVPVSVFKDREIFVWVAVSIGFVPKVNVAPFFRRLLEMQATMGGPYFSINPDNSIGFQVCRQLEGLDLVEFRSMLDSLGSMYWQRVAQLVQEFQLPQQPL